MNKKLFGILLVLILLFIPQTVFADFASCVLITENTDIYIDLSEDNILDIRIYGPSNDREYSFNITNDEKQNIIGYLKSYIEEDELTSDQDIINTFFEKVEDIGYLYGGYVNEELVLAYSYNRLLMSEEELENGYITAVIEKKLAEEKEEPTDESMYGELPTTIGTVDDFDVNALLTDETQTFEEALKEFLPELGGTIITMLLTSCLVPLFIFIMFIKILKIAASRTKTLNNKNRNGYQDDDEFFNQAMKELEEKDKPIRYRQNKKKREPWSNDNDDDPFSVK